MHNCFGVFPVVHSPKTRNPSQPERHPGIPFSVAAIHERRGDLLDLSLPFAPAQRLRARYNGAGSVDEAENFTCRLPGK